MKSVAKYNIFKGVSTVLTIGTPIVTLACCGDFYIRKTGPSMSAATVFVLLLTMFFFKDKILENWKTPPTFILCTIILILLCIIESIIIPIKNVCIATMIATGVDEFTFKRLYKNVELVLPKQFVNYKHFGFIFTTTNKLEDSDAR